MTARPLRPGEPLAELAVDATLRAAARRRLQAPGRSAAPQPIGRQDWRRKVRQRPRAALVLFVVDASESMGTRARMAAAKGAVLGLLTRAYQQRDRVAMVVFEGERATLALAPTRSVDLARRRLARLPTGGATPLADGLRLARRLARAERLKDPEIQVLLAIVSDGEANVPLQTGRSVASEIRSIAQAIRRDGLGAIVIDTAPGPDREGLMKALADQLGADYHHIDRLRAGTLLSAVQAATSRG